MKTFAIVLPLLLSATPVLAQKTITCDEAPGSYGYHERFVITLNARTQIVKIDAQNWNDKTDRKAGFDSTGSYDGDKPLIAKAEGHELVYHFSTEDFGDGDYQTHAKVTVYLPASLQGRGEVIEDQGQGGKDDFIVECK